MNPKFIKILGYELYPADSNIDQFNYICRVLDQRIDPETKKPKGLNSISDKLFCSPLKRAKECINIRPNLSVIHVPELSEIPFDLEMFCSREEWEDKKSVVVRKYFKEAFIDDNLLISRKKLEKQTKKVIKIAQENPRSTLVSHTFRLTIIRAHHDTNGNIFKKPNLIGRYIFDEKTIMKFGEEFILD
jgi:hypothetical protein